MEQSRGSWNIFSQELRKCIWVEVGLEKQAKLMQLKTGSWSKVVVLVIEI